MASAKNCHSHAENGNSYDGAALGEKYVPPEHKGPLPPAIDGHKLYTGSCHCGAVTLAFMSKPLDETFTDLTAECNCSICGRVRVPLTPTDLDSQHNRRAAKEVERSQLT